jgi:hypothetical protein
MTAVYCLEHTVSEKKLNWFLDEFCEGPPILHRDAQSGTSYVNSAISSFKKFEPIYCSMTR